MFSPIRTVAISTIISEESLLKYLPLSLCSLDTVVSGAAFLRTHQIEIPSGIQLDIDIRQFQVLPSEGPIRLRFLLVFNSISIYGSFRCCLPKDPSD